MATQPDPLAFFRLKPIRAARVSEISETTAAAPVPTEERINFHIGNPLQDPRLSSAFLRIALGIDVHQESLRDADPDAILEDLGWESRRISRNSSSSSARSRRVLPTCRAAAIPAKPRMP